MKLRQGPALAPCCSPHDRLDSRQVKTAPISLGWCYQPDSAFRVVPRATWPIYLVGKSGLLASSRVPNAGVPMYDDFNDLLLDVGTWWRDLAAGLRLLAEHDAQQTALWPVDDFITTKRYVTCPRRGTHLRLNECWMCWCDVAWGKATRGKVLRNNSPEI